MGGGGPLSDVLHWCAMVIEHAHPECSCRPPARSGAGLARAWSGSWVDPAFVSDPMIDHEDERVQRLAAVLHQHERRAWHDPEPVHACVACARRATLAVRTLDG